MDKPKKRKRLLKLWELDKRCYWCGCETVLVFRPPSMRKDRFLRIKNEANFHHLRTKYEDRTDEGVPFSVLACYECCHRREQETTKARPIEELHQRSSHGHRENKVSNE